MWRKDGMTEEMSFSMAEYAWTNCEGTSKVWEGVANRPGKIHPTQKPVALYEWILNKYAKPGDIILDTHVGSASSLIACRNTNHKYVGFEIDKTYYELAKKRLDQETAQMNIFDFMEDQ